MHADHRRLARLLKFERVGDQFSGIAFGEGIGRDVAVVREQNEAAFAEFRRSDDGLLKLAGSSSDDSESVGTDYSDRDGGSGRGDFFDASEQRFAVGPSLLAFTSCGVISDDWRTPVTHRRSLLSELLSS